MSADTLARPANRAVRCRPLDLVAALLFVIASTGYFIHAARVAATAPYWMDEVLAVWTARQPDVPALWSALVRGAEFSPPLFDLTLHGLIGLGARSPLAMRLSSIMAIYFTALAMMILVRRHAGWPQAALAGAIVLSSGLFVYAVQARPYACVTAAFAWALVLWNEPPRLRQDMWNILLGLLLIAMGALHFYSLLLMVVLAGAEVLRAAADRSAPRWPVIAATAVGAGSILLWAPIVAAAQRFSGTDVWARDYYGAPIPLRLAFTYRFLIGWLAVPLIALIAVVLIVRHPPRASALGRLALVLCMIPVVVFAFALFISHSFSDRYAVAVVLGFALLLVWLTLQLGRWADTVALVLLAACAWLGTGGDLGSAGRRARADALALAQSAPPNLPIVTGDGLRFLELYENGPKTARRLVYLDLRHVVSDDPTNRHQVERWKTIRADLPVVSPDTFLCATPAFLLFTDPNGGMDDAPRWLTGRADFAPPALDRPALTLVRSRPCPAK